MKNHTSNFHLFLFSFCCFVFFGLLSIYVAFAGSYQKIAPGDTITLGEFVFDDDFVATTTACTVGITSPLNVEVVASTTPMTANSDGWHFYNYTTAGNAPSGVWPSVIICGTVARGDLVIVDKSFVVDWSVVSTSTIKGVVDESLTVATSSLSSVINAHTDIVSNTASSSIVSQILSSITSIPALVWSYSSRTLTTFGTLVADVWTNTTRTLTGAGLDSGSLATLSDVQTATSSLASAITAGTGAVNINTDVQLLAASTSLATFINNNSNVTILAASTSLASYLSAHTDAASSSIASFVNANTNSTVLAASTSLAAFINANTNTQASGITSAVNLVTESASTSLAAALQTASSSIVSQITSSILSIPASVWAYGSRSLSSFGTLVADVWTATTRTLTGAGLDSGTLATLSDIQTATSSLASAITAGTSAVNSNTNAQLLAASTSLAAFINNNSNVTILAASTSLASYLSAYTDAASSSIASFVNANTNSTILAASTSLATFINAHTDAQASGIVSAVNLVTESASSSLFATLPASIWSFSGRTLTSFGTLVTDAASGVWGATTRTLTSALLGGGGSLATESYIDTATSTLTAEIAKGWTVTLSDFGETTVNTAYKAKLQVLNYATIPTDADSLPTVVITDSAGTVQVGAGVMTKDSDGTYSYSYSISGSAVGGVWETVVSVVINGETVKVNDYWSLSSSPADVAIIEITDKIIPTITANVKIDNMGTSNSDFYYVYCIVTSENNLCGGNDDIDFGSDTAYINAGSFINVSLTLDEVSTAGTYWFKVKARALTEPNWAASTEQFIAESAPTPTPTPTPTPAPSGGGGGGGGGGAPSAPYSQPAAVSVPTAYKSSDFNRDGKVNSVDFSILLAFWQKLPPFKNPYVDINKDGKVNSIDFSILLYQWNK